MELLDSVLFREPVGHTGSHIGVGLNLAEKAAGLDPAHHFIHELGGRAVVAYIHMDGNRAVDVILLKAFLELLSILQTQTGLKEDLLFGVGDFPDLSDLREENPAPAHIVDELVHPDGDRGFRIGEILTVRPNGKLVLDFAAVSRVISDQLIHFLEGHLSVSDAVHNRPPHRLDLRVALYRKPGFAVPFSHAFKTAKSLVALMLEESRQRSYTF